MKNEEWVLLCLGDESFPFFILHFSFFIYTLIVLLMDFEVSLRMCTNRADFRSFLAHYEMSAVAAFPYFH